jgi:hypothetical protein
MGQYSRLTKNNPTLDFRQKTKSDNMPRLAKRNRRAFVDERVSVDRRFGHKKNGYILFSNNARIGLMKEWKSKNPERTILPDIMYFSSKLGSMWKIISEEDKNEWKQKAVEANEKTGRKKYATENGYGLFSKSTQNASRWKAISEEEKIEWNRKAAAISEARNIASKPHYKRRYVMSGYNLFSSSAQIALKWKAISEDEKTEWNRKAAISKARNIVIEPRVSADGEQTPVGGLSSDAAPDCFAFTDEEQISANCQSSDIVSDCSEFVNIEQNSTDDDDMVASLPVASADGDQAWIKDLFDDIFLTPTPDIMRSLKENDFRHVDLNADPGSQFTVLLLPTLLDEMSMFFSQKIKA